MAKPRDHLKNAPIAEAVIDFRVIPRDGASVAMFDSVASLLGSEYREAKPMQSVEATFGMEQGELISPKAVKVPIGIAFKAQTAVGQFRMNGFTFNKLVPYTSWNEVFAEAMRLWRVYLGAAQPRELSRVAVRYINRLLLPGPADLGEYLLMTPQLPEPISPAVQEYLTRVATLDRKRNASAVIVQALESSLDPAIMPVLLDIDAFRNDAALAVDDASIPSVFQLLRELKNEIFFATLTEKTVEMYE